MMHSHCYSNYYTAPARKAILLGGPNEFRAVRVQVNVNPKCVFHKPSVYGNEPSLGTIMLHLVRTGADRRSRENSFTHAGLRVHDKIRVSVPSSEHGNMCNIFHSDTHSDQVFEGRFIRHSVEYRKKTMIQHASSPYIWINF